MIRVSILRSRSLLICSLFFLFTSWQNDVAAQPAATYSFTAYNTAYAAIAGTGIPGIQADDATVASIPLGFTFNFAGTNYTQVSACSNGWIAFSNNVPTAAVGRTNTQANANTIGAMVMPLWDDLGGQAGTPTPTATYTTSGAAPNRVFTIQWTSWRWIWSSNTNVISFQVKLFETTNVIQFLYSQGPVNATSPTATIGIFKTNTDWQTLNNATASPTPSTATFTTGINAKPATGQVYEWTPPAPCTGTPTTTASAPANVCPNVAFTLSCTQPIGTGITYQWYQASNIAGPYTAIPGATTASYSVAGGITSTMYYYVITTCSNSLQSYTSNTVTVNVLPANVCNYCNSTATSTADEEILNVTLNTLNNSSTCANSNNKYSDFRPLGSLTNVYIGSSYNLSLTLGTCGGNYGRTAKVWIDYNGDGVFQDPAENVYTVTYTNAIPNPQTATTTITIPPTAVPGITGMRVAYDETTNAAILTPCLTYTWGETEDYLVTLDVPPPCAGPPAISGPVATPATFDCSGAPDLDLTSFPSTYSGITYQWQSSPANQNIWTSISTPQSTPAFTAPVVNANTDYRCIAVCTNTNESTISSTVSITINGVTAAPDTSSICLGSTQVLTAAAPNVVTTLYSENFNGVNTMTVTTSGSPGTQWTVQPSGYTIPCSGTQFSSPTTTNLILANADNNCTISNTNTQLTSPLLNTTGYTTLTLTFNHYFRYLTGAAKVDVSTDGGLTWTTVQSFTSTQGGNTAFTAASVNLNAYTNQPNFKFRFNYVCGWDWYWALDDVKLEGLSNNPSFSWVANPAANAGLPAAAAALSPANGSISVTPAAGGTYVYTVTSNAPGCTTADAVIIVDPGPSGAMSFASSSICSGYGDTVFFTGTPGATVTYTVNAGPAQTIPLDATGNAYVLTGLLAANTTYTLVSVTAVNGCVTSYNTASTINIDPLPVIDAGFPASNSPLCSGTTLNLFVNTTPVSATYSWTGQAFITPDSTQNPVVNNAQVSWSGTYTVTATTSAGCSVTGTTDVTVIQSPVINVVANSTAACGAGNGSIVISGLTPNGNYVMSYTTATVVTSNITANGSGQYTIANLPAGNYTNIYVVENACTSNVVNITVTDPPPPLISNVIANDPTLCGASNGSIILQGLLANTNYDVYYNNAVTPQPVTTDGAGNLTIANLPSGTYDSIYLVRVNCYSNVVGPVTLVDPQAPLPPVPVDVVYCQYDVAVPLTATPVGTGSFTLKWYTTPTGGVGVTPGPVPPTNTPGTFTWYVTETDSVGCESPRTVQYVVVKDKPTVPVTTTPAYTYCQFDSMAVVLTATGDSLRWYDVPTGGTAVDTAPVPSTAVAGVFTWYVTQTKSGCESDRLPITVTVIGKPDPPLVKDIVYCQGDVPAALTAIGSNLKWFTTSVGGYVLANAPVPQTSQPDTSTWYVSQTVNGCESDRAALTVITYYRPTAEIITSRDEICAGDTITFTYVGNGTPLTAYDWHWPSGSTVLNGQGVGPYIVRFNAIGPNVITLTATENGCSSPLVTHTVYVRQIPEVTFSLPASTCVGDPAYLQITYANMPIENYLWNFHEAHTADGLNVEHGTGPYYLVWDQPGSYVVDLDVNSSDNCSSQASGTIVVHDHPEAKISASVNGEVCAGEDILLTASVNNSKYTYKWSPRQFFDYDYNSPVVTAHADRSQVITLKVTNEYGCESTDSVMINTRPCCELVLPTAFSPNGDGRNDLFHILNPGRHKLLSLSVYNLYGQQVFTTSDENAGWDGSLHGVAQESGTYTYLVKFRCDDKDTVQKGDITLVR